MTAAGIHVAAQDNLDNPKRSVNKRRTKPIIKTVQENITAHP